MRIIFVRHGKPDYKTDTLTELGRLQAKATAERLADEGISEIYASTMGRAMQTAEPTAELLGLPITGCDFMREVTWGSLDGSELLHSGHPWKMLPDLVAEGTDICCADWQSIEGFKNNKIGSEVKRVVSGAEAWLNSLGYRREGKYFRVIGSDTAKTVAMISHGGASTAVLSYMFNIPFSAMCMTVRPYFCSVTVVTLSDEVGKLIMPQIEILSDMRHVPKNEDGAIIEN